jgi:hypothetical protein
MLIIEVVPLKWGIPCREGKMVWGSGRARSLIARSRCYDAAVATRPTLLRFASAILVGAALRAHAR